MVQGRSKFRGNWSVCGDSTVVSKWLKALRPWIRGLWSADLNILISRQSNRHGGPLQASEVRLGAAEVSCCAIEPSNIEEGKIKYQAEQRPLRGRQENCEFWTLSEQVIKVTLSISGALLGFLACPYGIYYSVVILHTLLWQSFFKDHGWVLQ